MFSGMTPGSTELMVIKNSAPVCVAIVYHTGYGHTGRQAEAVRQGVEEVNGVTPLLMSVEDAEKRWEELSAAQAIIFGTPTYMGGPSARFKAFQDATSPCHPGQGLSLAKQARRRLHQLRCTSG